MKLVSSKGENPDLSWLCPMDSQGHTLSSPVLLLSWLQSGQISRVEEENPGKGDMSGQACMGRVTFAVFMVSRVPILELMIKQ